MKRVQRSKRRTVIWLVAIALSFIIFFIVYFTVKW